MKNLFLAGAVMLLPALASASGIDVKGKFAALSATAIVTQLPSSADEFSALAGQISGITLTVKNDLVDADTIAGSLTEFDGWRNNDGGIAAALGFGAIEGAFEAD